jgi:hypothetical protein
MIVIGCWWLLREVELSNASVGDVTFTSKGKPQLLLPVSKADASALGEMRSHECACEANVSNPGYLQNNICPACTLAAQASDVRKEFPALGDKAPLFPDEAGGRSTRYKVIETISLSGAQLGLKDRLHNGAEAWGGHSLRRGGAQFLAAAGIDVWRIQALARHSSMAILRYIENAHLTTLSSISTDASSGAAQNKFIKDVKSLKELVTKTLCSQELESAKTREESSAVKVVTRVKYVANLRKEGRVHKLSPMKGITLCKWPWRNSPFARLCESALGPCGDAIPFCNKCIELDSGLSSGEEESMDGDATADN